MNYFKEREFACKCCGEVHVHQELMDKLNLARHLAGFAFEVTSGYRCPKHNAEVGSEPTSSHVKGWAADIKVSGDHQRFLLVQAAITVGFRRIGVYHKNAFVHLDLDPNKSQDVIWAE